jgi:glycosyltransferase involved in cell wall biosynthesis
MRVHQMTATLAYGDAISNDILEIALRLKTWGLDARIYAEHVEARVGHVGQLDQAYERYLSEPNDLLIYHYSIYTTNLKLFAQSQNRKIVIYHNITPPEFFHGFDSHLETLCRSGRLALPQLRDCDLALAVSEFNRRELIAAGIPEHRTAVLPIFLGLDKFAQVGRDPVFYRRMRQNDWTNLLYVGRLAPNKGCDDLVKLLYMYRKHINPAAHLWLVGNRSIVRYVRYLEALIARLGLADAVTFTDRVSLGELRACYEASDVFLCGSRHEGFGVPLLEAMYFGLPVMAYHAAAIPETLGGAGVLFERWAYAEIVETLHLLVTDTGLRGQLVEAQRRRLADFDSEHVEAQLRRALGQVGAL